MISMNEILQIKSIKQYNDLYGFDTINPLITIANFDENVKHPEEELVITVDFYAVYLKETKSCTINYGKTKYDYDDRTIVSFAPGQTIGISVDKGAHPRTIGLIFHPEFIRGTELAKKIKKYNFFLYESNEALHLSPEERIIVLNIINLIKAELNNKIDSHSKTLILTNIELLLDYCLRFYDRQFNTRNDLNKGVVSKFETLVNDYLDSGKAEKNGIPSVKYFADKVFLSANYFGDLIKRETGKTAKEYIQLKTLAMAKEWLLRENRSVTQVSEGLGFQYPQHFIRFFKKYEGVTPNQYRMQKQD